MPEAWLDVPLTRRLRLHHVLDHNGDITYTTQSLQALLDWFDSHDQKEIHWHTEKYEGRIEFHRRARRKEGK